MSDVTEHNEKVLRNQDRIQRVHELWKSIPGVSDEQAIVAAGQLAPRFEWTGSVLNLDGKPATVETVREHFGSNYGFLLPAENVAAKDTPQVDPARLALARSGNLTARAQIVRQLKGDVAATDALIAGKTADDTGADKDRDAQGRFKAASPAEKEAGKNNPWAPDNFNVTRQGQIVKALGMEAAQRIAKAAGSHVGATRPAKVA